MMGVICTDQIAMVSRLSELLSQLHNIHTDCFLSSSCIFLIAFFLVGCIIKRKMPFLGFITRLDAIAVAI